MRGRGSLGARWVERAAVHRHRRRRVQSSMTDFADSRDSRAAAAAAETSFVWPAGAMAELG